MAAGTRFVSGPKLENGTETKPIIPAQVETYAPTEFHGSGTVFPDENGVPKLHLHGSLGREGDSSTGCFREDAIAWLTMEVLIEELVGEGPVRRQDRELGVSPLTIARSSSVVGLRPPVHVVVGIILHYPAVLLVPFGNDEPVDREFIVTVGTADIRASRRGLRTELTGHGPRLEKAELPSACGTEIPACGHLEFRVYASGPLFGRDPHLLRRGDRPAIRRILHIRFPSQRERRTRVWNRRCNSRGKYR